MTASATPPEAASVFWWPPQNNSKSIKNSCAGPPHVRHSRFLFQFVFLYLRIVMGQPIQLALGEIPRLRDDEQGYGPRGRGYIVHVDIPEEVERAWERLAAAYPELAGR